MTTKTAKFFVTVNASPFGAAFSQTEDDAISLAESAKAELPTADVVAWCQDGDQAPFEVWENGNPVEAA
jgi:hypothetical protein